MGAEPRLSGLECTSVETRVVQVRVRGVRRYKRGAAVKQKWYAKIRFGGPRRP